MWLCFQMTAMRSQHAFGGKWVSSHWHHLWCLWSSDWLCFVVISSSEIIQFDWLALTSFLPCSWPSFTSWLCSISPSLPLGRATLPSLVRTHGSPGKSINPPVFTPHSNHIFKTPLSLQRGSRMSPFSQRLQTFTGFICRRGFTALASICTTK